MGEARRGSNGVAPERHGSKYARYFPSGKANAAIKFEDYRGNIYIKDGQGVIRKTGEAMVRGGK